MGSSSSAGLITFLYLVGYAKHLSIGSFFGEETGSDINGNGVIETRWGGADRLGWCDALSYCEHLTFSGYDDWRLPNVHELRSILDFERVDLAIPAVFGAMPSAYWSSTSSAVNPANALDVRFDEGGSSSDTKSNSHHYVRAVRSLPW